MKIIQLVLVFILSFSSCYGQLDSLLIQGKEFARNRDYLQAEVCFKKALELNPSAENNCKIYNSLGLTSYFKGNFSEAIQYYNYALNNSNSLKLKELTLINLGAAYQSISNNEKALEVYQKAYTISSNQKNKTLILNNITRLTVERSRKLSIEAYKELLKSESNFYLIKQNLARLYAKSNQIDSAIYYYQQALLDQGHSFNPISLEINKEMGDLYYKQKDFDSACTSYHKAIEDFRYLQAIYIDDNTRFKSINKYKDVFVSAIECTAKLGEKEATVAYMEEMKAPILETKLAMNRLPDTLKTIYRNVEHDISDCIQKDDFTKFDSLVMLKTSLLKSVNALDRKGYRQIINSVPKNMALVHYSYSDSLLTTCVLFNGEKGIFQQKIGKDFFANIDTIVNNTILFGNDTYQDYRNYLRSMSDLYSIFEPQWPIEAKRLMIIPYSKLYQLPFEALTRSEPDEEWADFTNIEYVINRYAFNYSPSIAALQNWKTSKVENAVAFIPSYQVDSLNLKYSISEAEALQDYFDTDILQGEDARVENFFNAIGNYDIISIIAHGESEEIILNQDTIRAEELYRLNLDNYLTVLSTCQSSTGVLQATEGYLGTARKFLESGSESVLASLWDIPDESTRDIMSDFYKNLSDGYPKDIALQKAKVNYLNSQWSVHRSPAFWSGLILMGNCANIESSNSKFIYVVLGGIVILLLCTLLVKYLLRSF